jgi:predicted alpha/beta-hydrolase family hydrolase
MFVTHGPPDARHLIVLAPGDAGALTDPAPTLVASVLAARGVRVIRFAFPPCDTPDDEVRDALLAAQIRAAAATPCEHLVLGGFSRGARVSAGLVHELGAVGLLAWAYPFHARRDPDPGDRVAQLAALPVPALICQGTRDTHGNRQQVEGYRLPPHVKLHWVDDANHALRPRPRSGRTQAEVLTEAAEAAATFVRALGGPTGLTTPS